MLCMCAMRKKHFLPVYILSFYFGQLAQLTQDNLSKTFLVKPKGSRYFKTASTFSKDPKKTKVKKLPPTVTGHQEVLVFPRSLSEILCIVRKTYSERYHMTHCIFILSF